MFEVPILRGTPATPDSVPLGTRLGHPIANERALEPDEVGLRAYAQMLAKNAKLWSERRPACGVYNCAGHVWASRRTSIYDARLYEQILRDDGYRELRGENPKLDDIVVYRAPPNGPIFHVARVVKLMPVAGTSIEVPVVLSKLNDFMGEVIHAVGELKNQMFPVPDVSYWTDRP